MSLRRFVFGSHPRRTLVRVLVLAAVSFVMFRWVLVPIRAEGISMLPTYRSGSLNLVNRLAFSSRQPSRGDVVAIRLAGPHVLYVKRIVALPGERFSMAQGPRRSASTQRQHAAPAPGPRRPPAPRGW